MKKYKAVSDYIKGQEKFGEELTIIRDILLNTELEECMKWGMPTYCLNNKNILGLAAFKHHFCIWFHQGALIKDDKKLLINAQKGKTRAMRQMRFHDLKDVKPKVVANYVEQAIENHKKGKSIKIDRTSKPLIIPKELKEAFNAGKALKESFNSLTPWKQREYCDYISSAKREATKQSRLDKIVPLILKGVGLNDKYKS